MNILVYNVAAAEAGALTILKDFYDDVRSRQDHQIRWTFVVGTPQLADADNIKVLRYPWVKKSWLHRLWFERFTAPRIAKSTRPALILSLQNLLVPKTKTPQVLYVHQPLPFVPHRFGLLRNTVFWIYQNVIGRMIIRSIRKAASVIVQTRWMKQACIDKAGVGGDKISIIPPRIELENVEPYADTPENRRVFFYPAGPYDYKDHMLILKACAKLMSAGITDYKVIFTLTGQENKYARLLRKVAERGSLPVVFSGQMCREEVFSLYARSVLLFPSFIETFGLPLVEAKKAGAIVLAADMPFGREILNGYRNAAFFGMGDADGLFALMKRCMAGELEYKRTAGPDETAGNRRGIVDLLLAADGG